jgi:phosphohistidine phosphatase
MKIIKLMRHAKSSWANPDLADFARPLNPRGLWDAPFMGSVIFENDLRPDLIISSPAKRAKQTAILVKETAEVDAPIKYIEQIYEASPGALLKIVSTLSDQYNCVMLVGHNPGIEGFIKLLTGETQTMPTASFAKINLKIEKWTEIEANCGKIEVILRPKELKKRVEI